MWGLGPYYAYYIPSRTWNQLVQVTLWPIYNVYKSEMCQGDLIAARSPCTSSVLGFHRD